MALGAWGTQAAVVVPAGQQRSTAPSPHLCTQVEFKLFGVLPGAVGLRGTVQPVGTNEDTVVSPRAVSCWQHLIFRITL